MALRGVMLSAKVHCKEKSNRDTILCIRRLLIVSARVKFEEGIESIQIVVIG